MRVSKQRFKATASIRSCNEETGEIRIRCHSCGNLITSHADKAGQEEKCTAKCAYSPGGVCGRELVFGWGVTGW